MHVGASCVICNMIEILDWVYYICVVFNRNPITILETSQLIGWNKNPKMCVFFLLKQLKNRSETYLVQIKVDANIFMGLLTSLYNSLFAADFTCLGFQWCDEGLTYAHFSFPPEAFLIRIYICYNFILPGCFIGFHVPNRISSIQIIQLLCSDFNKSNVCIV